MPGLPLGGFPLAWMVVMSKKRVARKRDIKDSGIVLRAAWAVGSGTRAWSELWDRIFQEVFDDQENRITDTVREWGNDC